MAIQVSTTYGKFPEFEQPKLNSNMQQPDTTQSGDFQKGVRELNEKLAAIPTLELIEKVDSVLSNLCRSGGKSWNLRVPPTIDCPDMLISEATKRLRYLHERHLENGPNEKTTKIESFNE